MIVDQRTYTVHPGKTAEYLKLYEEKGMPVQVRVLGKMLGYYFTEIGPLNQIVHMWGYDSLEDRTERRAQLFQEQEWQDYIKEMRPLLASQENKILIPAPFFDPAGK